MLPLREIPLVLASRSKRRLALLARLGIAPHSVLPVDIDETPRRQETPRSLVSRLALDKARVASRQLIAKNADEATSRHTSEQDLPSHSSTHALAYALTHVLAADTIVVCARRVLGKPRDSQQARYFLSMLSGRRHRVWTAVVLSNLRDSRATTSVRLSMTRVSFKRLTHDEIEEYVAMDEWRDSAGGYRMQGFGEGFVRSLNGSHSAVIGLPLFETRQLLRAQRLI